MKGVAEFLKGVSDVILSCSATFEQMHRYQNEGHGDTTRTSVSFHTDIHLYTMGLDYCRLETGPKLVAVPGGWASLTIWHGSGESDIEEGPVNEETWQAFKLAIEEHDKECVYKCKQEGKPWPWWEERLRERWLKQLNT